MGRKSAPPRSKSISIPIVDFFWFALWNRPSGSPTAGTREGALRINPTFNKRPPALRPEAGDSPSSPSRDRLRNPGSPGFARTPSASRFGASVAPPRSRTISSSPQTCGTEYPRRHFPGRAEKGYACEYFTQPPDAVFQWASQAIEKPIFIGPSIHFCSTTNTNASTRTRDGSIAVFFFFFFFFFFFVVSARRKFSFSLNFLRWKPGANQLRSIAGRGSMFSTWPRFRNP